MAALVQHKAISDFRIFNAQNHKNSVQTRTVIAKNCLNFNEKRVGHFGPMIKEDGSRSRVEPLRNLSSYPCSVLSCMIYNWPGLVELETRL